MDCGFSPEAALEKVGLPTGDSVGHGPVGAYKVRTQSTRGRMT